MSGGLFIKGLCNQDANGNPVTYHVVNSTHGPLTFHFSLLTLNFLFIKRDFKSYINISTS